MGYVPSPHTLALSVRDSARVTRSGSLSLFQDTVSVHRPSFYADRFLKFMGSTVFRKLHRKPRPPVATTPQYHYLSFVFGPVCLSLSALRGASSKRKKGSLYAGKSASQEALSPSKEEKKKEEKKALSMEQLDAHCKHKTVLFEGDSKEVFNLTENLLFCSRL